MYSHIRLQIGQRAFREEAITRPTQNDTRLREPTAIRDDLFHFLQKELGRFSILIVDISYRYTDDIWGLFFESSLEFRTRFARKKEIDCFDLMPGLLCRRGHTGHPQG